VRAALQITLAVAVAASPALAQHRDAVPGAAREELIAEARRHEQAKEWDLAADAWERAYALDHRAHGLLLEKARVLAAKGTAGDERGCGQALAEYERYLGMFVSDEGRRNDERERVAPLVGPLRQCGASHAAPHLARGRALARAGKHDTAATELRTAFDLGHDPAVLVAAGEELLAARRCDAADEAFRAALENPFSEAATRASAARDQKSAAACPK
jgi:tetratricopeptide (TPR) repeat protein